jgi:hypothetical protein
LSNGTRDFAISGSRPFDALDLQQREVFLPRFWRTNLSAHEISCEKTEALYLRRRYVDVVGTGEIAVVLAAKKSVSLRENLQDAFAMQRDIRVEQVLLDAEDELGFADDGGTGNLEAVSHILKLVNRFSLELGDVHLKETEG